MAELSPGRAGDRRVLRRLLRGRPLRIVVAAAAAAALLAPPQPIGAQTPAPAVSSITIV